MSLGTSFPSYSTTQPGGLKLVEIAQIKSTKVVKTSRVILVVLTATSLYTL